MLEMILNMNGRAAGVLMAESGEMVAGSLDDRPCVECPGQHLVALNGEIVRTVTRQ